MLLDFTDLKSQDKSLYLNLYEQIKSAVESGIIKSGEKLPSIREAASQLRVSRTTIENAYLKLCIEGVAESLPQKGYYICKSEKITPSIIKSSFEVPNKIKYDFSTQKIDAASSDVNSWKKIVRCVLRDYQELTSYGDPLGELGLRQALATYSYKARGVSCKEHNIIIGAGIGPLLNILCGLIGRNVKVGIENGGFKQANLIFSDYGINSINIPSDNSGAMLKELNESHSDILFLQPSALGKISITSLSKRRNEFIKWAKENNDRLIIEDDYNGELRYTARSLSSFQGKLPESTIYIGSFSKLLLPSVRIAYMVLPDKLITKLNERKRYYNQTCGKIEQLALKSYIESGGLEKHLRRLRKLYYNKSQILCKELTENLSFLEKMTLYETSLIIKLKLSIKIESKQICNCAENNGIRLIQTNEPGTIGLCFAGIAHHDIKPAVEQLDMCLRRLKTI